MVGLPVFERGSYDPWVAHFCPLTPVFAFHPGCACVKTSRVHYLPGDAQLDLTQETLLCASLWKLGRLSQALVLSPKTSALRCTRGCPVNPASTSGCTLLPISGFDVLTGWWFTLLMLMNKTRSLYTLYQYILTSKNLETPLFSTAEIGWVPPMAQRVQNPPATQESQEMQVTQV